MVHGQKIEENVKDLQAQLKDLLEEVVGELPKLKVSFEENKELAALRAQCKQQEAELATSKNLCASQEDLIKKLTEQLAASQKELSDTKEKDAKIIEDQDREIVELKRQLRDLKTDDEAKIAEIATKVAKLENDIKLGMEQLESKNAEIDTLKKNVSDLEDELTKLRQQLAVLKEEMDNLTKELASLQEARDKLAKQGKVAGDLEAELKKLREQLTALKEERDKLAKAAAMLKDAQDEIERLKKLLADMEAAMKVLEGQEKMSKKAVDFDLERAIQLTTLCKELVAKEHWVAHEQVQEHTEHTAAPIKNRTTVGIAFDDKSCVITNVLVGGPAFNSNKVFKGDKIVSVDSVPVVGGDIIPRLEGSDDPGSVVMIGLQRKDSNIVEELKLRRMDNKQIADKRQLFELFTKLLDKAIKKCDKESEVYTTEALDLWTAEMLEQYTHDEVCLDHFHNMQSATGSWLDELLQMLTGSAPAASAPGTSVQSGVLVRPWTFRRRS
jgi:predicted  nucleic acid-binding Zn-ribbon protein